MSFGEENFDSVLAVVKEYIFNLWEVRKDCMEALLSLSFDPRLGIQVSYEN